MNPDEIWKELDLGSLLINPQLITENHNKLDPFLKHEKKWRKPNYKALKSRYDVIPTKPNVYHKQYINRLADPIKGKYMKYQDIFDDNDSLSNNYNRNEINSNNDNDNNDDGGFFITEDINTNTNNTKSNINDNKYKHVGSSIRKKFNEAITNANRLNNSIWKDKFKQINNVASNKKTIINKKIKRKKVKAIQPYRIPIVLDNIRSSGYGYNIKTNKNIISQPKWKIDRLEEFKKLKHSPNKLLNVNKKLRSQSISDVNVNSLASNNNNELEKVIDEGTSRIRHRNMPPLPTINHKYRKSNKIVRSAPNLITRTNEHKANQVADKQISANSSNINKYNENLVDSKINKPKHVVSSSSVSVINVDSITTKSNNKKIIEQDLKYKSTEQLLEALQRIDSYDKTHNEDDIKLTNKLTKHIKNISSTLATAESHINSYKDITIEDIQGGLRLPLDLE